MKKIFNYQTVKELIQKAGFGTYKLFLATDNQCVAGSHLIADLETDGKMSVDNLLIDLEGNIDLIGNGLYRIVLKKSSRSQANTEVSYVFQVNEGGEADNSNNNASAMAGIGFPSDKIEEIVTARVKVLMEAKEAELKKQREVDQLRAEIETLKKRKPVRKKNSDLQGLLNLALVGGSAFIVKQWPDTQPMVEKALGAISNMGEEEEEEEEEEGTGFTRPA